MIFSYSLFFIVVYGLLLSFYNDPLTFRAWRFPPSSPDSCSIVKEVREIERIGIANIFHLLNLSNLMTHYIFITNLIYNFNRRIFNTSIQNSSLDKYKRMIKLKSFLPEGSSLILCLRLDIRSTNRIVKQSNYRN